MISDIEIKALAEMEAEIAAETTKTILISVIKTLLALEEMPTKELRIATLKAALEMLEKEGKQNDK